MKKTHNKQEGKNTNTQKGMQTNVCIKVLENIFLVFTTCHTKNVYKLLLKPLRQSHPVCVCVLVCVIVCVGGYMYARQQPDWEGGLCSLRRIYWRVNLNTRPKLCNVFCLHLSSNLHKMRSIPTSTATSTATQTASSTHTHTHSHGDPSPFLTLSLRCGQVFCYLRPTTTS